MGLLWSNDSSANMTDESSYPANISLPTTFTGSGGVIWFRSLAGSLGQAQLVTGGYMIG